jgi:hypothetical protein
MVFLPTVGGDRCSTNFLEDWLKAGFGLRFAILKYAIFLDYRRLTVLSK